MLSGLKCYLKAIYESFYSRRLYSDVINKWKGSGSAYLFVLCLVVMIPVYYTVVSSYNGFYETEGLHMINQLPDIDIVDGKAHCKASQPYEIKSLDGETVAIINLDGKYEDIEKSNIAALLTRDKLIVKKKENETRVFDLKDVEYLQITSDDTKEWAEKINFLLGLTGFPISVFFLWIYKLIYVLIMALASNLLTLFMKVKIDFEQRKRISVIASTPVMVLNMFLLILALPEVMGWRHTLIVFIYMFFILKASKDEVVVSEETEEQ